jgi:hypothetical protein
MQLVLEMFYIHIIRISNIPCTTPQKDEIYLEEAGKKPAHTSSR